MLVTVLLCTTITVVTTGTKRLDWHLVTVPVPELLSTAVPSCCSDIRSGTIVLARTSDMRAPTCIVRGKVTLPILSKRRSSMSQPSIAFRRFRFSDTRLIIVARKHCHEEQVILLLNGFQQTAMRSKRSFSFQEFTTALEALFPHMCSIRTRVSPVRAHRRFRSREFWKLPPK